MADVYEVEHLRLASSFAAKVLRRRQGDSIRRFLREARLLAQLKSDHIVTVLDVCDPDEDPPFYVMELLAGQDLRRLLSSAPELSVERAVKFILDACRGIGVAHAAGLVHRDLKPENLFVTHRDSGEEIVKLLDFGVVKAEEGTSTEHGALIGTVRYMAPEQIEHAGVVSARADVRGLGAILYECLAGRPPHVADSLERLLFKVLNENVASVKTYRPSVPVELDDVILRALERDPSKRFASAIEFARALQPFLVTSFGSSDLTVAEVPKPPRAQPSRTRRWQRLGWLSAVGTAVAVGSLVLQATPAAERQEGPKVGRPSATATTPSIGAPAPRAVAPVAEPEAPRNLLVPESHPASPLAPSGLKAPRRSASAVTRSAAPVPMATAPVPTSPFVRIDPSNPYDR
jgi:serine/threonine-protein kinase